MPSSSAPTSCAAPMLADLVWLGTCPACTSAETFCLIGSDFDVCMSCRKIWERLPAGEPYTRDGEQLAFKKPCDNCAFRRGSAERADVDRWNNMLLELSQGGHFYCHKGVPLASSLEAIVADPELRHAFDFPLKPGVVTFGGVKHTYKDYDRDAMRLCRGFLASIWGPQFSKFKKDAIHGKVEPDKTTG